MSEWERCGAWVQAALDRAPRTHTLDDVAALIRDGDAQFWPGQRSAIVTRILDEPQCKVLFFWLAGGSLAELIDMERAVSAWGKSQGCGRAMLAGREGWTRALDFTPAGVILTKEL